jgi:hypothetical protein
MISGRMRVKMDDGSEEEFGPGDVNHIPPDDTGLKSNTTLSDSQYRTMCMGALLATLPKRNCFKPVITIQVLSIFSIY